MLPGSSVVEQVTVNHLVAGSNPARAAILCTHKMAVGPGVDENAVRTEEQSDDRCAASIQTAVVEFRDRRSTRTEPREPNPF